MKREGYRLPVLPAAHRYLFVSGFRLWPTPPRVPGRADRWPALPDPLLRRAPA